MLRIEIKNINLFKEFLVLKRMKFHWKGFDKELRGCYF